MVRSLVISDLNLSFPFSNRFSSMRKQIWVLTALMPVLVVIAGCGAAVEPGVASGPDETTPSQTPEEESFEAEAAKSAASQ
jgi:hypothetical protein